MKLNYEFSNLLGSVYRGGDLVFLPDGNNLLSPVGNKISLFDLKNNRSETLPIEARFNIRCVTLNSTATNALLITENSDALYISLVNRRVLHRHRFGLNVRCAAFSPNDRKIAVCRDKDVQVMQTPGVFTHQYTPFLVEYSYKLAHDVNTCVTWSSDSRMFVVGSRDGSSRICAGVPNKYDNLRHITNLGGHTQALVGSFFMSADAYDMFSVCRAGKLTIWACDQTSDDLVIRKQNEEDEDDEIKADENKKVFRWNKQKQHTFRDAVPGAQNLVTAVHYSVDKHLLVTGFSTGIFVLHEMPEFNLIHSLTIAETRIECLRFNATADWIAIGCGSEGAGHLMVWEWQSETYVMKEQAHTQRLTCVEYSPDGWKLATGSEDGKVKVWSVASGFCEVTFAEHEGGVNALTWTQFGKAVLSAGRDGTVRACDMKKYRNFRTLVCPRPAQLSCVCVDAPGEIVCAGAMDVFDIYVWSLQNGRLLEVLAGHEAPVSAIAINPVHSVMASVSWDATLRVWDVFSGKTSCEQITLSNDGLDVSFNAAGDQVTALTSDSLLTTFDWRNNVQLTQIEARLDLDPSRAEVDLITGKKSATSKSLTRFCYSPDGQFLLTGGQSKYICMYHAHDQLMLRKFKVTTNFSLASVADDIDRRRLTEFGNTHLWDISDEDDIDDETDMNPNRKSKIKLPGVRNAVDMGDRVARPEIRVHAVAYSPTGRAWAACTTEGLLIYSLDKTPIFEPYDLSADITPDHIRSLITQGEHGKAVVDALKLNQSDLVREAVEACPMDQELLVRSMSYHHVKRLLSWIGDNLTDTRHLHAYARWIRACLDGHGNELKQDAHKFMPTLTLLQEVLHQKQSSMAKICEHNQYSLSYLLSASAITSKVEK